MLRFGLCCIFREEPIRFRATTAKALLSLDRRARLAKLSRLAMENASSLLAALEAVRRLGFGAFRVLSPLLPRYTHPEVGYSLEDLPGGDAITAKLREAAAFRALHDLRLSFHPDQFVVLSSPRPEVVERSLAELEYQGLMAELVGAETITLHGGGGYGDKGQALARWRKHFAELSPGVRGRLALENDDVTYTVRDLLPACEALGVPLVYDVHHHRCNPDGLSVAEATALAAATWREAGREPWFHVSSPRNGWGGNAPKPHADYLDPSDFPTEWLGLDATVDVEAKAKELAVARLMKELGAEPWMGKGRGG